MAVEGFYFRSYQGRHQICREPIVKIPCRERRPQLSRVSQSLTLGIFRNFCISIDLPCGHDKRTYRRKDPVAHLKILTSSDVQFLTLNHELYLVGQAACVTIDKSKMIDCQYVRGLFQYRVLEDSKPSCGDEFGLGNLEDNDDEHGSEYLFIGDHCSWNVYPWMGDETKMKGYCHGHQFINNMTEEQIFELLARHTPKLRQGTARRYEFGGV
ncbi:hypothetical protein SprV_0702339200 [Sparganum proliferum]